MFAPKHVGKPESTMSKIEMRPIMSHANCTDAGHGTPKRVDPANTCSTDTIVRSAAACRRSERPSAALRDAAPLLARPFIKERYDNLASIALVTEPTLLLHGTRDETVDPKMAERLEEAGGPNITRINLKEGGHWAPLGSIAGRIWQQWEAAEALAPGDTPTAP